VKEYLCPSRLTDKKLLYKGTITFTFVIIMRYRVTLWLKETKKTSLVTELYYYPIKIGGRRQNR
jgi:hypothetical protein